MCATPLVSAYLDRFTASADLVSSVLAKRLDRVNQALQPSQETVREMDHTRDMPQVDAYLTSGSHRRTGGMLSTLGIKPYHLPILLAMSLVLLRQSDARVPKKPHPVADQVRLLHKKKHPLSSSHVPSREELFGFSKRVYKEAWKKNVTTVSEDFQHEFDTLNESTNGDLGKTLTTVFEIRLLELQHSVRHAKAMLDVVHRLTGLDGAQSVPDCVDCVGKSPDITPI